MGTPYLLSCAAIFALVGLTLVGIGGVTDNWSEYVVNRKELLPNVKRTSDLNEPIYFSRNVGLFLQCFPDTVPSDIGSFSKFGTPCVFLSKDFFPDEATRARYNTVQSQRMHFMRAGVITYFAGLALGLVALVTGAIGCFKPSARLTLCTGFMFLFTALLLASSMGVWHYVQYIERRVLNVPPFHPSWEPALKMSTTFNYGFSYVMAWVGVCATVLAAFCLIFAHNAIKRKKEGAYDSKYAAYYQQYHDKALVPYAGGTYNGAGNMATGGYELYPANGYAYYGHPTMANTYYGYLPYGGH